jgi:hypothetical protein
LANVIGAYYPAICQGFEKRQEKAFFVARNQELAINSFTEVTITPGYIKYEVVTR